MPQNKRDINLDRWTICDAVMRTRVDVLELMLQQHGRLDDWHDPYCVEDFSGRTLLDHAINHPDGIPRKRQPIHAKIITLLLEAGLQHDRHMVILRKIGECVQALLNNPNRGHRYMFQYFTTQPPEFSEIERICELVLESASDRRSPVLRQFYEEQIKDKWEQYVHKSISARKQSSGLTQEFDEGI